MAYVSMKTIAAQAGVSVMTVSLALRNQKRVSPALALKIQAIARELEYQPPALLHEAMEQLRMKSPTRFQSRLALCSDSYVETSVEYRTLKKRAAELGYGLELFSLPNLTRKTLRSALRNLNIRGILLSLAYWLSPDLEFLFEEFACVSLGDASRRFGLPTHFAEVDRFYAGKRAAQEVLSRGYCHIGLVRAHLDPSGLLRAGVYSMSSKFLSIVTLEGRAPFALDKERFLKWFRAEKPDCILTILDHVRVWLEEAGYRIPEDVGLAHLDKAWFVEKNWSGMEDARDEVDAAGLNKLVSMLRQGKFGIPPVQECILIKGNWTEGTTLRPPRNQLTYGPHPAVLRSCIPEPGDLKCLELGPYVNRSFTHIDRWFGAEALQHCEPGEHKICGTKFRVLDETLEGKAALIMGSRHCPGEDRPNPTQVDIPIGRRIKSVHFLHACGWSGGPVRDFAAYHLIDTRGRRMTLPLIDRRALSGAKGDGNIQDWWPVLPPLTATNVRPVHLTAFGNIDLYSAYLYILEWVNPNPRKVIQTLRITSNLEAQTTLGVVAITIQL